MYCTIHETFFEGILQRLYSNQKDNKSKQGFIHWRLRSGQSAEMVILLCPSMEFIYRVSSKNTLFELPFCETRFEDIWPSTASWLEGHIPSNLFSQFQKFRKCLFFGTPTWCSIAIVQSAIPWLAETMFALLVP